MHRIAVATVFLAALACSESDVEPADCPLGSVLRQGVCAKRCANQNQCRVDQDCVDGFCDAPALGRPEIRLFEIQPNVIVPSGTVRVRYAVTNATELDLSIDDGQGPTQSFVFTDSRFVDVVTSPRIDEDVTITLAATGPSGTVSDFREVRIDDVASVRIDEFVAVPDEVIAGAETTLQWRVVNADRVTISDSAGDLFFETTDNEGSLVATVERTTQFNLQAENETSVAIDDARVEVVDSPDTGIINFVGRPSPLNEGSGGLVSWVTRDVQRLTLRQGGRFGPILYESTNPAFVEQNAFVVLAGNDNGTFVLQAVTDDGSVDERTVELDFVAAPLPGRIESFTVTPNSFDPLGPPEQPVLFSWSVTPRTEGQVLLVTNDIRRLQDSAVGSFREDFPSAETVVADLAVSVAGGGSDRKRVRVWAGRPEQEPENNNPATADPADGRTINGTLGGNDPQDWSAFEVQAAGTVHASFLDTLCPAGLRMILRRGNTIVQERAASSSGCPEILRRGLPSGLYRIQLIAGDGPLFRYSLAVAVDPNLCGDGVVGPNEACDDGELLPGDGCNAVCGAEPAFAYTADIAQSMGWTPAPADGLRLTWLPYPDGDATILASDEGFAVVPFPAPLRFFGRTYAGIVVHTNGLLALQPNLRGPGIANRAAWGRTVPNALIAPAYTDLEWVDDGTPLVWTTNDPEEGEMMWFDFSKAIEKESQRALGQVRVGITRTSRIIFQYGELTDVGAFIAGVEDHNGKTQLDLCDPVDCIGNAQLRDRRIIFANDR